MFRALLAYGVMVAEFLLAAGALYGLAWLMSTRPRPTQCADSCWGGGLVLVLLLICGLIALAVGLLVALVLLTVRLRRAGRRGQLLASGTAMVRMASRTVLATPSRSGVTPRWNPSRDQLDRVLREVRARGWALADEDLAPGIRSIATGVRDGHGRVVAALNVTVHAAETSVETLTGEHLPRLLCAAADISHDWALQGSVPVLLADRPLSSPSRAT
jgi:hypothetical protein